jgi:hypothetical protein
MPGSNWAAYAREFVDVDEILGIFSASKNLSDEILASENPKNKDYALTFPDSRTQIEYSVNPYFAAACHARFIDEALTESDENCRFDIEEGCIIVRATKPIEPGVQLLIRYGQDYWLKRIKYNPIELSFTMFRKYSSTMKDLEMKAWGRALASRKRKESVDDSSSSLDKTASHGLLVINHEPKQVSTNSSQVKTDNYHNSKLVSRN